MSLLSLLSPFQHLLTDNQPIKKITKVNTHKSDDRYICHFFATGLSIFNPVTFTRA